MDILSILRALSNPEECGSKRVAFQERSESLTLGREHRWTQGSRFVSGSMSVEGSAAMAGVRLLALRGAPNVSCCTHSGLAQRARWGCLCAWGTGWGALQEPFEEAGTALRKL